MNTKLDLPTRRQTARRQSKIRSWEEELRYYLSVTGYPEFNPTLFEANNWKDILLDMFANQFYLHPYFVYIQRVAHRIICEANNTHSRKFQDWGGRQLKISEHQAEDIFLLLDTEKKNISISGLKINTQRKRYRIFKENPACIGCGVMIAKAKVCRGEYDRPGTGYLAFYSINGTLMTIDHYVPKSKGGDNRLSNLRTMCTNCNNKKGSMLPGDWEKSIKKVEDR